MVSLLRFQHPQLGSRFGLLAENQVYDLSAHFPSLAAWLQASAHRFAEAQQKLAAIAAVEQPVCTWAEMHTTPDPKSIYLLPPVDTQEVWAAGVTYQRSREARQEEAADGGDVYARVYAAERPELFFKAYGEKVVGTGAAVGIRADSTWNVPEPELAVVINPACKVVGFTIGNDLSSRDIEGANPLYLPQAKIYTASCALGPLITISRENVWPQAAISIAITRREEVVFSGQTHTQHIHRSLAALVEYLGRSNHFPNGAVLLTGTGIVPPADFSLQAGDLVSINIEGIGELRNPVFQV